MSSTGGSRIVTTLVAGTIGLSAFLLFSLELLVGRLVLPAFGGAPAAWATVLVFFQGILLVGYLYGHVVVSRLSVAAGAIVHSVVTAVAVASLLVWPPDLTTLRDPSLGPILDLLRVMTIAVGLPSFLLTTTTPLLSSWYARLRGAVGSDDPFWLYAVSNGASFAALVAYPLAVERVSGLSLQRAAWMAGFVALAAALVTTAALVVIRGRAPARATSRDDATPAGTLLVAGSTGLAPADPDEPDVRPPVRPAVTWRRRFAWTFVAAVPSGLLSAITNLIAADLVSAPLLWMGPLAIYLLSFVVAFSRRGRGVVPYALLLTPVAVTLLWVPLGSVGLWPAAPLVALTLVAFAVVATGLNGILALDRPGALDLTDFYLWLAVGGVLGGSFVGVIAPLVFPDIWEYPILLVLALVAVAWGAQAGRDVAAPAIRVPGWRRLVPGRPGGSGASAAPGGSRQRGAAGRRFPLDFGPFVAGAPRRLVPYAAVAILLAVAILPLGGVTAEAVVRWLAVGALLLLVGGIPRFFVAATAVLLLLVTLVIPGPALFQGRSFFGVSRVVEEGGAWRILMNGTTVHGLQATDPSLRRVPTAYYVESGPVGDLFAALRAKTGDDSAGIGIAGLGSGALAVYARERDDVTFYEIDPVVIRVASDPSMFSFLTDTPTRPTILEGDARLTLQTVPDATHDLLIVDAFSSDTPPIHLLTVEAIRDAMRTVKPGGILALHLSNRYYDLAPAVAGAASALGLAVLERDYAPTRDEIGRLHASPSIWVAVARSPADLDDLRTRGWMEPTPVEPLTDDRPDLLRLMRRLW